MCVVKDVEVSMLIAVLLIGLEENLVMREIGNKKEKLNGSKIPLCPGGENGKHAAFKLQSFGLRVRVSPGIQIYTL